MFSQVTFVNYQYNTLFNPFLLSHAKYSGNKLSHCIKEQNSGGDGTRSVSVRVGLGRMK